MRRGRPLIQMAAFFWLIAAAACRKVEKTDQGAGYFSIIQFAKDQFDTYSEQPFTLRQVVTLDGKTDSAYIPAASVDWASIFKLFFATDISDRKFLDQYQFSEFEDNVTDSRVFYYTAKQEKLFTRTLQIAADPLTGKIRTIYIETRKKGRMFFRVQKLFYRPIKLIQIQEYEEVFPNHCRDLKAEYHFLN